MKTAHEIGLPAIDTGKRVLLVEDSFVGVKALSTLLAAAGLQCDVAHDMSEAVKQVCCHNYDLILLDLRLPDADGFETARRIRFEDARVPIVAVSAYPVGGDWQRCVEAGIDDYLCKGFGQDELQRVIRLWAHSGLTVPIHVRTNAQALKAAS